MTVVNTAAPTISGSAVQGQTLHATSGTWTYDLDHISYAYQWERCDAGGANCVDINGATSSSYILAAADVGHTLRVRVTATEYADPSPPPAANYYFDWDFGVIKNPPWTSIQADENPGAYNPGSIGVQQSVDGHSVKLVTAPDGNGRAIRFELRDADGPWQYDTTGMRSQLQMSSFNTWNESSFTVGEIRWWDLELWLPNNDPAGEYFDWARSNWNTWMGLHPNAGGIPGWGCFDIGTDGPYTHPFYMTFKLAGGTGANPTQWLTYPSLFQLTNGDGSRYAPNYNRRLRLQFGGKFSPDNGVGWFEAWVDGVNVVPRTTHATMWTGDTSSYFKIGPYKSSASALPSGKTVMYFTKIAIGTEATIYAAPDSIDSTGVDEVATDLETWLNSLPNGSTAVLPTNGTYLCNRVRTGGTPALTLTKSLNILGSGCTIKQTQDPGDTSDLPIIKWVGVNNVTIQDLNLLGARPTNADWNDPWQHGHGFSVWGCSGFVFDNVSVRNVYGDGIYFAGSTGAGGTQSQNCTVQNSTFRHTGRMGIACVHAKFITADNCDFTDPGLSIFDIEPNSTTGTCTDITFQDSTATNTTENASNHLHCLLFVANHEDSGQAVQRVTLTGNSTVTGGGAVAMPVKIFVAPCWNGDFPTPTCDRGSEPRYTNITITNNTSATGGGVATYAHITTLTQSGNSTPTVNTEDIT